MKRQDIIIIAVLFALLMAWPFAYKRWIEPRVAPKTGQQAKSIELPGPTSSVPSLPVKEEKADQISSPALFSPEAAPKPALEPIEETAAAVLPGRLMVITNTGLSATFSTRGGGIVSAVLHDYRRSVDKNSGPMVMDFSRVPSLAYNGLNGFSATDEFAVVGSEPAAIIMEAMGQNGMRLTRRMALNDNYQVIVSDVFSNSSAQAQTIPQHAVQIGPMQIPPGEYRMSGMDYLGVDVLGSSGGEGVINWAGKLRKLFKEFQKANQDPVLPRTISKREDVPVDWVAVKNKFFAQILVPEGGAAGYSFVAERVAARGEKENPSLAPKDAVISNVCAAAVMPEKALNAGETHGQSFKLYLGPKKFSILRTLGLHQEDIMEFGMWSWFCKILLWVLNRTYAFIPNYGVAIIVLTILIRIIFWPVMHKSSQSMKKMQAMQPLMNEIKAKYKDSPRKMQEETMALYRKHKINPMSSCLPMLIQIPVFFALFVILRSAIELRFASFLWIDDLSAPERLFADVLPIPLNILPILMAVSQAWQQALMPTGDPNQQKMMLFFMPVMMLVMFYTMPSALVLFWTASQCIAIVQQLIQNKIKTPLPVPAGK